jgi:hypothetical protein
MQAWVTAETRTAAFGDQRLDRRYAVLLDRLSQQPQLSIPAACRGLAETTAAYRFFDSERTDTAAVLQPHRDATLQRVRAQAVVVVAQDTTELDLTRPHEKVGGPLNDAARWGLFVHPLLALTPQRVPLGVVQVTMWNREAEELARPQKDKQRQRKQQAIEDKESYRWLEGYRAACQLAAQAPQTQVIAVADSEGDIYECFLEPPPQAGPQADGIVRACQDRALQGSTAGLWQSLRCTRPLGTLTIRVSARKASTSDGRKRKQARSARKARVTVRAARVLLRPPARPGVKLPAVLVNAVLVREEKPTEGEEAIEWLLLSSLPVATFAAACQVIDYYCCRWEIEIFFRVLKGGCRVEELQLETVERLHVCLALYLIVAWRVLFVLMLGRECPELPCTAVLAEEEWKSVYVIVTQRAVPERPPELAVLVEMIAALGDTWGASTMARPARRRCGSACSACATSPSPGAASAQGRTRRKDV